MAHKAKGWNLKNHYVQIMENKQKKRDTKERVRAYEKAKRSSTESNV